jgi:hypothetical protein
MNMWLMQILAEKPQGYHDISVCHRLLQQQALLTCPTTVDGA